MRRLNSSRTLVEASVEREANTTQREHQEQEIEDHPRLAGKLLHRYKSAQVLKALQSLATLAVPGDHESAALQAEQLP